MPTPSELLAQSLAKLQTANRVDGSRNSYRKDMAVEYAKVVAYLQGGARPSGVTSDMGMGLMLAEDARRALNVVPVPPDPIPSPTPEPTPIAGKGYSLVFQDEFDAPTMNTSVWRLANWYESERPQDFTISNSIVSLHCRQSDGYPGIGAETKAGHAWQYGYFEARMWYSLDVAAFPAFWMMSENWAQPPSSCANNVSEIDIMEAFGGGYPRMVTCNLRSNTSHPATNGVHACNGGAASQVPNVDHQTYVSDTGFVTAGQWHTYSCLWTPATIAYYMDERLLGQVATFPHTAQPHRLFLQAGKHGEETTSASELVTQYDWVRVWQA